MNKKELIHLVANETGLTKVDCEKVLVSILGNITKAVKTEDITLIGFGTFKTTNRKAREGRNPQTGVKINIPAKNVVGFKAGKKLKESVN